MLTVSLITGLLGYLLGTQSSAGILPVNKQSLPSPSPSGYTEAAKLRIDDPELFLDKQKAISLVYPRPDYTVKADSEAMRSRNENSGIPQSFLEAKGYAPPKVTWALKVEEKQSFQGRYGIETPTAPFAVWVFDNSQNRTINEWFEMYWYYPFTWGSASQTEMKRMEPLPKMVIDGEQTWGYDMGPTPRGYLKLYYIKRDDKMYLFQLLGEEKDSIDFAIASTFKFLLPNSAE